MKIMRINFSHATYEEATRRIERLRGARGTHIHSKLLGTDAPPYNARAVLLDTRGPEIRTGNIAQPTTERKGGRSRRKVELTRGSEVRVTVDPAFEDRCDESVLYVDYPNFLSTVDVGDRVLLDDGLIELVVTSMSADAATCTVENTGSLGSGKGVNLPGQEIDLPPLSEKDKRDLAFGVEWNVDFVAASFVRKASDVQAVIDFLNVAGEERWGARDFRPPLVISKIESEEGLNNFDEILRVSDGIMVARGDLGVEIPLEAVFEAQKNIIDKCRKAGKPVIVATQMLESMQKSPRPTRAEVSDVANAVLDGADAVMLSGETANGEYPVESCRVMKRAVLHADAYLKSSRRRRRRDESDAIFVSGLVSDTHVADDPDRADYIAQFETVAKAAVDGAKTFDAPLIVCLTRTGLTAKLISAFRPDCPVMCVTNDRYVGRQLQLYRSLVPVILPSLDGVENDEKPRADEAVMSAKKMGLIRSGQKVIIVSAQSGTRQLREAIAMRITTVK